MADSRREADDHATAVQHRPGHPFALADGGLVKNTVTIRSMHTVKIEFDTGEYPPGVSLATSERRRSSTPKTGNTMTSDRAQALPLIAVQESCACCSTPTAPMQIGPLGDAEMETDR